MRLMTKTNIRFRRRNYKLLCYYCATVRMHAHRWQFYGLSRLGLCAISIHQRLGNFIRARKIEIIALSTRTQRQQLALGSPPNPLPAAAIKHYSTHITHTRRSPTVLRVVISRRRRLRPAAHDFNWMLESEFPLRMEYLMIDILCALCHNSDACAVCARVPHITM